MKKKPNPNGCRNWSMVMELKKNKKKTEQKEKEKLRRAVHDYN